ncbi:MAG: hypothetical protein R3D60_01715 [Paracoccaceae bacterium]
MSIRVDVEKLEQEVTALRADIKRLEIEQAERRPVSDILKLFGYFFAAIVVVFGLLGIKQISDLQPQIVAAVSPQIDDAIERQISQHIDALDAINDSTQDWRDRAERLSELEPRYQALIDDLNRVQDALGALETADSGGLLQRISDEVNWRSGNQARFDLEGDPFRNTVYETTWRAGILASVTRLIDDEAALAQVTAEELFNLLQDMRRIDADWIGVRIMNAIPQDPAKPEIEALRYGLIARMSVGEEREEAFQNLLLLLASFGERNPQIVISEANNATETLRRFSDTISVLEQEIERRERDGGYLISYAYAALGELYMMRGTPNDSDRALEYFEKAQELLLRESPLNHFRNSTEQSLGHFSQLFMLNALDRQRASQERGGTEKSHWLATYH